MNLEAIQIVLILSTLGVGTLIFIIRGVLVYLKIDKLEKIKKKEFEYKRVIVKSRKNLLHELDYNSKDRWKLCDIDLFDSRFYLLYKRRKYN